MSPRGSISYWSWVKALAVEASFAAAVVSCIVVLGWASWASAAVITVQNAQNSGSGSLRQAIADAQSGDEIEFDSGFFNTPRQILLYSASGELLIGKNLTITGPGKSLLTVSGRDSSRVFHISSGGTVVITDLTVADGYAALSGGGVLNEGFLTMEDCHVKECSTGTVGGGIRNHTEATLVLDDVDLTLNMSPYGGGGLWAGADILREEEPLASGAGSTTISGGVISQNTAFWGGGVASSGQPCTLVDVDVLSNSAHEGGGIFHSPLLKMVEGDSTFALTVSGGTVLSNSAELSGGGILCGIPLFDLVFLGAGPLGDPFDPASQVPPGHALTVRDYCTISLNTAATGGGICCAFVVFDPASPEPQNNSVVLSDCQVVENSADSLGGGILFYDLVFGELAKPSAQQVLPWVPDSLTVHNSTISGNVAGCYGGGICNGALTGFEWLFPAGGVVALNNCTVTENYTTSMFPGPDGGGGGIYSGSTGWLDARNCRIAGNASAYHGGGVYVSADSWAQFYDSRIDSNQATISGGGIAITGFRASEPALFKPGAAQAGARVCNGRAPVEVWRSSLASNTALHLGGGIYLDDSAVAAVYNSTLGENLAGRGGGGLSCSGWCDLVGVTIAGNAANRGGGIWTGEVSKPAAPSGVGGGATIESSIVAQNTGGNYAGSGSLTSQGYNLEDGTDCGFTETGDTQNQNPLLGALGYYGASTLSYSLQDNSPAIDAIDVGETTFDYDQRGVHRQGDPDKGAYEYVPVCVPQVSNTQEIPAFSRALFRFAETGVRMQFGEPNSTSLVLTIARTNGDPQTQGALPAGIVYVGYNRYWTVDDHSGSVDGEYDMTHNLDRMLGIAACSDLELLKRADSSSSWGIVPCGRSCGTGEVTWTGIAGGFSQFGIGSTTMPTVPIPLPRGWSLFTYPCSPPTPPGPVLLPVIDPFYVSPLLRSNICGFSEPTQKYTFVPVLETGVSYWLYAPTSETLKVDVSTAYFMAAAETTVALTCDGTGPYPGWNLVGNPFWTCMSWDAATKNSVDDRYYVYNPIGSYWLYYNPLTPGLGGRTAAIYAGEGFEVHAQPGGGTLTMRNNLLWTPPPRKPALAAAAMGSRSWRLQVIAACEAGKSDPYNYVGVDPGASAGYDPMDVDDLAPLEPDAVMLYFPHADWPGGRAGSYTQDLRPPAEGQIEWVFEVKCGLARQQVLLSWPGAAAVKDVAFALVDLETGATVDMRKTDSYSFTYGEDLEDESVALSEAPAHRFALVAGSPLSTGAESDVMAPEAFTLGSAYPNPFNPVATISYDVPEQAVVSIEVYDALGQRIATLWRGLREPGRYHATWTGVDDAGQPAGTGVYFCRMAAKEAKFTTVRKLSLLR